MSVLIGAANVMLDGVADLADEALGPARPQRLRVNHTATLDNAGIARQIPSLAYAGCTAQSWPAERRRLGLTNQFLAQPYLVKQVRAAPADQGLPQPQCRCAIQFDNRDLRRRPVPSSSFTESVGGGGRGEPVGAIRHEHHSGSEVELKSRKRSQEIRAYFKDRLFEFCDHLSVRLDKTKQPSMTTMPFGRGSEGPRGLIAYYYAFLHTARRYSSSSFCPIVIDAPNQQGQDDMRRVMRFIIDKRPAGSQVIVATEDLFDLTDNDAKIVYVGKRKNQLLDEELYDEVSDVVRPYLGQLI
jgi:hypothetical protein